MTDFAPADEIMDSGDELMGRRRHFRTPSPGVRRAALLKSNVSPALRRRFTQTSDDEEEIKTPMRSQSAEPARLAEKSLPPPPPIETTPIRARSANRGRPSSRREDLMNQRKIAKEKLAEQAEIKKIEKKVEAPVQRAKSPPLFRNKAARLRAVSAAGRNAVAAANKLEDQKAPSSRESDSQVQYTKKVLSPKATEGLSKLQRRALLRQKKIPFAYPEVEKEISTAKPEQKIPVAVSSSTIVGSSPAASRLARFRAGKRGVTPVATTSAPSPTTSEQQECPSPNKKAMDLSRSPKSTMGRRSKAWALRKLVATETSQKDVNEEAAPDSPSGTNDLKKAAAVMKEMERLRAQEGSANTPEKKAEATPVTLQQKAALERTRRSAKNKPPPGDLKVDATVEGDEPMVSPQQQAARDKIKRGASKLQQMAKSKRRARAATPTQPQLSVQSSNSTAEASSLDTELAAVNTLRSDEKSNDSSGNAPPALADSISNVDGTATLAKDSEEGDASVPSPPPGGSFFPDPLSGHPLSNVDRSLFDTDSWSVSDATYSTISVGHNFRDMDTAPAIAEEEEEKKDDAEDEVSEIIEEYDQIVKVVSKEEKVELTDVRDSLYADPNEAIGYVSSEDDSDNDEEKTEATMNFKPSLISNPPPPPPGSKKKRRKKRKSSKSKSRSLRSSRLPTHIEEEDSRDTPTRMPSPHGLPRAPSPQAEKLTAPQAQENGSPKCESVTDVASGEAEEPEDLVSKGTAETIETGSHEESGSKEATAPDKPLGDPNSDTQLTESDAISANSVKSTVTNDLVDKQEHPVLVNPPVLNSFTDSLTIDAHIKNNLSLEKSVGGESQNRVISWRTSSSAEDICSSTGADSDALADALSDDEKSADQFEMERVFSLSSLQPLVKEAGDRPGKPSSKPLSTAASDVNVADPTVTAKFDVVMSTAAEKFEEQISKPLDESDRHAHFETAPGSDQVEVQLSTSGASVSEEGAETFTIKSELEEQTSPTAAKPPSIVTNNECITPQSTDSHKQIAAVRTMDSVDRLRSTLTPGSAVENALAKEAIVDDMYLLDWLQAENIANEVDNEALTLKTPTDVIRSLLSSYAIFEQLFRYLSEKFRGVEGIAPVEGFLMSKASFTSYSRIRASNCVRFLESISSASGIPSPFRGRNPFLIDTKHSSPDRSQDDLESPKSGRAESIQGIVFGHPSGDPVDIVRFVYLACRTLQFEDAANPELDEDKQDGPVREAGEPQEGVEEWADEVKEAGQVTKEMERVPSEPVSPSKSESSEPEDCNGGWDSSKEKRVPKRFIPPTEGSPFEDCLDRFPGFVRSVLGFIGDPVAVCRLKMTNTGCRSFVDTNEHELMRDAVRLGGMHMNVRPYFWLWVVLGTLGSPDRLSIPDLERQGAESKWKSVIDRDVSRSFGNLPPHKTGARLRTDSIVRALAMWGKGRIMKRGVKGSGDAPPLSAVDEDDISLEPTETVSNWEGVTPVGSFTGSVCSGAEESDETKLQLTADEDLALSGNSLSEEAKSHLREKLRFILHSLAAAHSDVGYCQGMDYVVAHLLRILQDTIRWQAATGYLPGPTQVPAKIEPGTVLDESTMTKLYAEIDDDRVVEMTCFQVMDTFFTSYNLRHFYWPELRCLKTCCLVFERLIQIKLPVLADHFEHHELNVGLFALGWFQTLFLYLPSMPSATVCHMWDIWLVERSFKIFFRVGTAILFLSQPTLLNHELEGMMGYLNTFPDCTLLSPDILIACALQIKVTNRMLTEIEEEVTKAI